MNAGRAIMMGVGLVIVLVGAYLLYFEANLNRWVSIGIVTAGILLFIGMSVMAFAGGSRSDGPATQNTSTRIVHDNREVRTEPRTEPR